MSSENSIKNKLEFFVKSYHRQQAIQGLVYTLIQSLVIFYLINYTEYLMWLNSPTRGVLFYGFCVVMLTLLYLQFLRPLGKLFYSSAQRMSYDQAAQIIGQHFPEISDKLLNFLQLERMGETSSSPLLIKSIEQKTLWLKPFSFVDALNWPLFKKNMYRFVLALFMLVFWGLYDVNAISTASQRLFNFQKVYTKPAPFQFIHHSIKNEVPENSDVKIELELKGKILPEEVSLKIGNQTVLMKSVSPQKFEYILKGVKQTSNYQFEALEYQSDEFQIKVLTKFEFQNIRARAIYPANIQKPSEWIGLSGDLSLPAGTLIQWDLMSKDANAVFLSTPDNQIKKISTKDQGRFVFRYANNQNGLIKFWSTGNGITSDTFAKHIEWIPDAYPQINLEPQEEPKVDQNVVILGNAFDDYGINRVYVEYQKLKVGVPENQLKTEILNLKVAPSKSIVIAQHLDLKNMGLLAKEGLKYRVAVVDNDPMSGGKTAFTEWLMVNRLSESELEKQINSGKDQIEKQLAQAQSQSKQLQRQSEKLKESISGSQQMNFELQEKVSNWIEKQQEQLKKMSDIRKQQEKLDQKQREMAPENKELQERRKDLEERMKRMEDPKLQELMKELQQLLEKKKTPQEIQQKMNQIDRRMQNQKEEMEQLMEQLKELRLEEQIDLQSQKMQEWIEKQEKLAQKTEQLKKSEQHKSDQQEDWKKMADELKAQEEKAKEIEERAKEIDQQNEKLEKPLKLDLGEKEINNAQQDQKEAAQELNQKKASKSQEKQKQAAQEMQKAQEKMQESLQKSQKERNSEDLQALRALLENLIDVSHKQEQVFTELNRLQGDNPRVKVLNKEQMNIKNMSQGIEDSLRALAKRQPMVSDLVTREIADINDNMERSFEGLKVRDVRKASVYEQYVMTGYNNLAVMLMESLKNVQQKMNQSSSSSPSGKMCSNPKPGNSGKSKQGKGSKLSEQQQKLGEKLQKMQQEGQQGKEGKEKSGENKGNKERSGKNGEKGKEGKEKSGENGHPQQGDQGKPGGGKGSGERIEDKEWVEMMLMQEDLRRKIEMLRKEALKEGKTGQAANLFEAEKLMDEQEKKLAQKQFDQQMMWRQKQIETRLLEHEKAQMQQGQEDNRQSKTGQITDWSIPPDWIEYQRKKVQEQEQLQKANPQWKPYFQKKSEEFLRQRSN